MEKKPGFVTRFECRNAHRQILEIMEIRVGLIGHISAGDSARIGSIVTRMLCEHSGGGPTLTITRHDDLLP